MSGDGIDFESSANLQRLLARSHEIFSTWFHLFIENIHLLNATSSKWTKSDPPLNPGDVVLFVVQETASGSKRNGVGRLGKVLTATNRKISIEQVWKSGTKTVLERNLRDVFVVVGVEELAIHTTKYFSKLLETESSPSKPLT